MAARDGLENREHLASSKPSKCELSSVKLHPQTPISDSRVTCPFIINTLSSKKVVNIDKIV